MLPQASILKGTVINLYVFNNGLSTQIVSPYSYLEWMNTKFYFFDSNPSCFSKFHFISCVFSGFYNNNDSAFTCYSTFICLFSISKKLILLVNEANSWLFSYLSKLIIVLRHSFDLKRKCKNNVTEVYIILFLKQLTFFFVLLFK